MTALGSEDRHRVLRFNPMRRKGRVAHFDVSWSQRKRDTLSYIWLCSGGQIQVVSDPPDEPAFLWRQAMPLQSLQAPTTPAKSQSYRYCARCMHVRLSIIISRMLDLVNNIAAAARIASSAYNQITPGLLRERDRRPRIDIGTQCVPRIWPQRL